MTQLNYAIRVSTIDDTQRAWGSILAGMRRFGSGVMAALRDVNLGVRPLVEGIDRIIERSGRLEVSRKAFEHLSGRSGAQVAYLARQLVDAAHGTLRLSEAMEIANRGLSSGLGMDQLKTIFDFTSRKAVATGEDVKGAIEQAVEAVSRGEGRALQHMGVLTGGLEEVRRKYDAIHGAKAFDALGPAAQKAEVVRRAIDAMHRGMKTLGLTGRETFFVWEGLKNALGDAVDSITRVVAGSQAVRNALQGVRDFAQGIADWLERGGKISEAFAAGLKVLEGIALDLGENLGRCIAAGVMRGLLAATPDLAKQFGITEAGIAKITEGIGMGRTRAAIAEVRAMAAGKGGESPPLTAAAQGKIRAQISQLDREEKKVSGDTDFSIRRAAARQADNVLRRRGAEGEEVPPGERQRLIAEYVEQEKKRRIEDIHAKRDKLRQRLGQFGTGGVGTGADTRPATTQPADRGGEADDGADLGGGYKGFNVTPDSVKITKWGNDPTTRPAKSSAAKRKSKEEPFLGYYPGWDGGSGDTPRANNRILESYPGQIANDVQRLISGQRAGSGVMSGADVDFYLRDAMYKIRRLREVLQASGAEGRGTSLDKLGAGHRTMREVLDDFEGWLSREMGVEGGPMETRRHSSSEERELNRIREESRSAAKRAVGRRFERTREEYDRTWQDQSVLTRQGLDDIDQAQRMRRSNIVDPTRYPHTAEGLQNLIRDIQASDKVEARAHQKFMEGIEKMNRGNAMEPSVRVLTQKMDEQLDQLKNLCKYGADVLQALGYGESQIKRGD